MKPLDIVFFPKGGFSSSHLNDIVITNDVIGMDSTYPNVTVQNDCKSSQVKLRKRYQKSKADFST
jgi:hypothetical protein